MRREGTVFTRTAAVVAVGLMGTAMAAAAETPVAVSPGDASKLALVDGRCPAFSWAGGEGAKSYELVVYRVGEEGEETEPVLRQNLPAPAYSWTPSLDRCLERGGQYAWSVRAVGPRKASEWSAPSLFEVSRGPSEAELEVALEIVRQYVTEADVEAFRDHGVSPLGEVQGTRRAFAGPQVSDPPAALALAAGDSDLMVNGAAVVTTATLAGALCSTTELRFLDQGDGTVLDCNTGLIWLKNASCNGPSTRQVAEDWVATLASGACGLTDGSQPGQWRLPEIGEFCSRDMPTPIGGDCPLANASDSLVNNNFSEDPKVGNAAGDGQWTEDDAFVGVASWYYWSATDSDPNTAWFVSLVFGYTAGGANLGNSYYAWPVRVGQ